MRLPNLYAQLLLLFLFGANSTYAGFVSQNFDSPGSAYSTLQSNDPHARIGFLPPPQVLSGGPSGNYLQLASRADVTFVDAQNAIVFNNSEQFATTRIQFDVRYHMSGSANGFGFVMLNTRDFGTSGGTVSSLKLDRIQVEQAHNHDPIGSRQTDFFQHSFQLSLNTFESDRIQLFYDGYKLLDQNVAFGDGWHDLSFQADFLPTTTLFKLNSTYLTSNSSILDMQFQTGQIDSFSARPMIAARIGGAGFGNFSVDNISYSQIAAVPEPTTMVSMAFGFFAVGATVRRMRKRR